MITAITLTGDRPFPFALCQQWVFQQTVQPDQWIVVDDGKVPLKPRGDMGYVWREPRPNDPKNTMGLNLGAALQWIEGDKIIIIEDDDYYAPNYIETMSQLLDQHEVVGIVGSRYYHLPSGGYMVMPGSMHASLAETAFRSSYLPRLTALAVRGEFPVPLDTAMWRGLRSSNRKLLFSDNGSFLHMGVKGLPGRPGIGVGHKTSAYHAFDTPDRPVLKKWVPNDYQIYLDIVNGVLTETNYHKYFGAS